jgi:hypothetical protein
MFTDSAQHVTTTPFQDASAVIVRAVDQARQFICGLHGHDSLLHFEQGRMSLQCTSCGHETPGWEIKPAAERPNAPETRARVVRLPLVGQRRVA